jgi:molecular chaperone GrpE
MALATDSEDKKWKTGIEHIYGQLVSILSDYGVEAFGQQGEEFNPQLHNSVELVEVEKKKEENIIMDVVLKGYKLAEKIIRPANVRVGSYKHEKNTRN